MGLKDFISLTSLTTQTEVAVMVSVTIILLVRWWRARMDPMSKYLTPNPPKDTVILHQYGKALTVPSISPFVMKLETYLRVAKIPYINKYSRKPGPKGKLPWIQYNDRVVSDSQFCIEFLNKERGINLNRNLQAGQLAVGHLVRRTVEESVYWMMLMWRLVFEKTGSVYKRLGLPSLIIWYMKYLAKPRLFSHGIGRHSQQQVTQMLEKDLHAVSQILGEKNFLFGSNVNDVTEFDCALFGQMCQLVWQMPDTPLQEDISRKFPNLVGFCDRMKMAFWSDWDERLLYSAESQNNASVPGSATETEKLIQTSLNVKEHESTTGNTTSLTANLLTNGQLLNRGNIASRTFNGEPRQRFTSFVAHQVHSKDHVIRSLSSKVSAASILSNQTTIMSVP